MVNLDGRVAIVTGAGRGLGREHALLLASAGARVVINDIGGATDGSGSDTSVAEAVASEIRATGADAIANTDDIADWQGAERLIASTVDQMGGLDVVVNNAGILRDRMLVNLSEADYDDVLSVHLKGTVAVTRHAAAYWRERAKTGDGVDASVVNTSSAAGLYNNVGQTNYGAAKAAIATFTLIAAKELGRYGVRVNAVAPVARTRLTEQTPGLSEVVKLAGNTGFDPLAPANVSPLVAVLASAGCSINGAVFHVVGGRIDLMEGWHRAGTVERPDRWDVEELGASLEALALARDPKRLVSESQALEDSVESIVGSLA